MRKTEPSRRTDAGACPRIRFESCSRVGAIHELKSQTVGCRKVSPPAIALTRAERDSHEATKAPSGAERAASHCRHPELVSGSIENEYVCKYGRTTGSTCGHVTSLNYSALGAGGFVRVEKDGANLSEGGDSGGPWYLSRYDEAWGIHNDHPFDDPNDAYFMPASRFEDAGLRVLTSL